MAAGDMALRILLNAQDNASSVIMGIGKALQQLASGNVMGAVAVGAATAAAAIVGFGMDAAKAAGNFQSGMETLVTGAGESQDAIAGLSKDMLKLSVDSGTSTDQLVKGMFMVESAGYRGADGMKVLTAASQGAKVQNADLGTVTNALTSIMSAYGMKAGDANSAMNGMIATVKNGKVHLQDLSQAMGNVLPIAASVGVKYDEVGAALATMTNHGMTAQRASMDLANAIRNLAAPGTNAVKVLKEIGLTSQQVKDALTNQGLSGALALIEEHLNTKFPAGSAAAIDAYKRIMGGQAGYTVALEIGGKNAAEYEQKVNAIASAMNNGKNAVAGFSDVQNTLNFQMDRLNAAWQAFLITVGQKLLPVFTPLVKILADVIVKVTDFINALSAAKSPSDAFVMIMTKMGMSAADAKKVFNDIVSFLKEQFAPVWDLIKEAIASLKESWDDMVQRLGGAAPYINATLIFVLKALVELIALVLIVAIISLTNVLKGLMAVVGILADAFHSLGIMVTYVADQFKKSTDEMNKSGQQQIASQNSVVKAHMDNTNKVSKAFDQMSKNVDNSNKSIDKSSKDSAAQSNKTWQDMVNNVKKWLDQFGQNTKKTNDDNWYVTSSTNSKIKDDTTTKWQDIQKSVSDSMGKLGNDIKTNWDAAWQNTQNLVGQIGKFIQDKMAEAEGNVAWNTNKMKEDWNNFWKAAGDMAMNGWNQIVKGFDNIKQQLSQWFADRIKDAENFGKNLIDAIVKGVTQGIPNLISTLSQGISRAFQGINFGSLPGFAGGVENFAGGWAVVGERGPELMYLPKGANIYPHSDSSSLLNAAYSSNQNMNIYVMLDGRQIGKAVTNYQSGELRVQGIIRNL